MAIKAKLKIGGRNDTFYVLKCDYALHRDVDSNGKPSSLAYGGSINLSIEITDDTTIYESMFKDKPINGTVTFNKNYEGAKLKEVSWEEGYIIYYREVYSKNYAEGIDFFRMQMDFTVSAEKIKIDNVTGLNWFIK